MTSAEIDALSGRELDAATGWALGHCVHDWVTIPLFQIDPLASMRLSRCIYCGAETYHSPNPRSYSEDPIAFQEIIDFMVLKTWLFTISYGRKHALTEERGWSVRINGPEGWDRGAWSHFQGESLCRALLKAVHASTLDPQDDAGKVG